MKNNRSKKQHETYFAKAAAVAKNATCQRSRCGTIIVTDDNQIIGEGFNSPPSDDESQRRCLVAKDSYDKKVTDKTCCMHAEQRAILDALRNFPNKLNGATLYFARLDDEGNFKKSGPPYCTICSKLALEVGIKVFALWQDQGIVLFKTDNYNSLSYQYQKNQGG